MTRINGRTVELVDDVGEGLRNGRRNHDTESQLAIKAHCNAFLASRGLPLYEGGDFFRHQTRDEMQSRRRNGR